jgi:Family of unknown function (DUF6951)
LARVEIDAGICGHSTTVKATGDEGYKVLVALESTCPHVRKIADDLTEVDALQQIGLRGGLPSALETAYAHCIHAACPVPSALIKSIEVAAGLALPKDVSMRISKKE